MDLKNAAAVCLISLFSATLVVLIARSLDSHAAARLEPQLASIVEELRALRGQGGLTGVPAEHSKPVKDGLVVYYFHSNTRCPTCQAIESQTNDTVQKHFALQLSSGDVIWKIVNYEQPAAQSLAKKFEIQMPVVVLARMKDGQVEKWNRLDEVWGLVGDKPAFAKYVREEIDRMLAPQPAPIATQNSSLSLPVPSAESKPSKSTPPLPLPK